MAQTAQIWLIIHAALTGFIIIPLIIVWFLTLGLTRRRGDPARVAFSWLKACHPFLVLSLMLIVVSDVAGIILISWQYSNGFFDTLSHTQSAINGLDQTYQYASIIGTFFERIVNAIFVVIFVEVGNGFRYAQLKKPPAYKNTLRIAALVGALAIFTLSVAYFAFPLAALVKYYQSQTAQNSNAIAEAYDTGRSLRAAGDVINFVISIAQVLFAAVVARQHAGLPARKSTILYLVATILDVIRWVVLIVLLGGWILPKTEVPDAWNVIDPIFNTWIRFVVLVLLLVIGNRRQDGLWSTIQHWMQGHEAAYAQQSMPPYGQPPPSHPTYYHYPPQQHPQHHPGWQYQQPDPTPGTWNPHELASPQVVRPEELDSHQMQHPPYYAPGHAGAVEAPVEKIA